MRFKKLAWNVKVWFWSVTHAWTLARRNAFLQNQVAHVQMVDICAKQGVIVSIRGSRNGWSATLGKRMDIRSDSFPKLLGIIADLPNRQNKEDSNASQSR